MNCRRAVELFLDYVANEVDDDLRVTLETHFKACPPCVVYLETYRATITLTRQLPREAPMPAELEQRLIAVLKTVDQAAG